MKVFLFGKALERKRINVMPSYLEDIYFRPITINDGGFYISRANRLEISPDSCHNNCKRAFQRPPQ